ncbi:unnamed protein product [Trifolium pratense]|nr:unnamed protein product [Trifolium pratense]
MVLMDSEGGRIHATVKKTLIYKFKDDLSEGKVYSFENLGVSTNGGAYRTTQHRYKMNFQFGSVVQRITNHDVKGSPFHLVPISDVVSGSYDTDYLVDVIGVLTGVGTKREITSHNGSTTKLNVIALEAQGHKIQCTLFGPYVDELNAFIASGDYNNAVVIVQLAKAKTFQDKIHIQNCMNYTRLFFNPSCPEGIVLRESLPDTLESPSPMTLTQIAVEPPVRPIDEFIFNTPRMTLQGLKDATTETLGVVCATVKRILNPDCFWYTACVCNKSVIPDSNMFFCDKCNKHVQKVFPRYCLKVRVMDHTDSASLVIFDREASSLFNMSCADMLDANQMNVGPNVMPPEIASLVEKTWLFKVETKHARNPRFEQTFKVRKICTDSAIIKIFRDRWDREEDSISKLNNEVGSLSTLLGKGKDVLVCGSTNVLSEDLLCLTGSSSKSCGKVLDCHSTPGPFTQDLMNKFADTVVNLASDSDGSFENNLIASNDEHSLPAIGGKGEASSFVVEGTPVGDIPQLKVQKIATHVVTVNAESVQEDIATITENDKAAIDEKGTKFNKDITEAKARGIEEANLVVVNVDDDFAESKKEFVTPNQIASIEAK